MAVRMAQGSRLKDDTGKEIAGPGDLVEGLPVDIEAQLLRGGSAVPVEAPANLPEEQKEI